MDVTLIKDLPKEERPRERFVKYGANSLSNQELLAILLRTGTKKKSAMSLATNILQKFESIKNINDATIEELLSINGIGTTKAVQVLCAIELGKRIMTHIPNNSFSIRSPEDCANLLRNELKHLKQEHFMCVYLNVKNEVITKKTLFIGSLNRSIVHPREVFKEAVKRSAASIICVHNHPSGDPTPSQNDINVTKRLLEVGKIMGIDVLDHIIIGGDNFVSLKEKGEV